MQVLRGIANKNHPVFRHAEIYRQTMEKLGADPLLHHAVVTKVLYSVISFNLKLPRFTVPTLTDVTLLDLLETVVRRPGGNYSAVNFRVSLKH